MSLGDVVVTAVVWFNYLVLGYFVLINAHYFILLLVGFKATRRALFEMRWHDVRRVMQSHLTLPISVITPAYNEEASVAEAVRSLLMLRYPEFEVVVVNDGSTDDTLKVLIERFALREVPRTFEAVVPCRAIRAVYESDRHSNLVVIDKDNGGSKADAVNAGINLALYPLFCAIDADSILEDDALLRAVRPFLDEPGVVAVGGIIRIVNGCEVRGGRMANVRLTHALLPLFQIVEYLRAFLFGRMAWATINGLLIVSGGFGLFDKKAVVMAGGYASDSIGEDFELIVRMHHRLREARVPYRIRFVPDPVCWTEVPESLRVLQRQRNRWQRGLIDTLWRHRKMIGRPRYGVVGLLALPAFVVFELLGPVIEVSGYLVIPLSAWLGIVNAAFMALFFALAVLCGVLLSVSGVLLEDMAFHRYPRLRDLVLLCVVGVIESFGYRQLNAWWRIRASWDYSRGRTGWGEMERRGFGPT